MKTYQSRPEEFDIQVNLTGSDTCMTVKPDETSDGSPYFICDVSGNTVTQLREEADGSWEQLWGKLDQKEVTLIGKAIKHKLTI
ncbi:hypothetical protein [Pedobacter steynii]|uniref:Uncharacterized protein n=1 Tax=Pedobacter steynii TaxID=430522 RepID=A0A1D7QC35_9SPHI|nr:hypothetical protein [Pedobacter steynii]AOM76242.1 hypothetical protein BFS30_03140 [Pedobacter steynii]